MNCYPYLSQNLLTNLVGSVFLFLVRSLQVSHFNWSPDEEGSVFWLLKHLGCFWVQTHKLFWNCLVGWSFHWGMFFSSIISQTCCTHCTCFTRPQWKMRDLYVTKLEWSFLETQASITELTCWAVCTPFFNAMLEGWCMQVLSWVTKYKYNVLLKT